MKRNFTRASVLAAMAALAVGGVQAKDLYLSESGSDSNTGLSADSPVATLTKVFELVEANDVIHVNGIVHMAGDAAQAKATMTGGNFYLSGLKDEKSEYYQYSIFSISINEERLSNLTFLGEDPENDGFDGDSKYGFFEIGAKGDFQNSAWTKFQNLRFQNSRAQQEGGSFLIHDHGTGIFDNCVFENNGFVEKWLETEPRDGMDAYKAPDATTQERGGAFHFQFGTLTITNSIFRGNTARRGGAICQTGGVLTLEDCLFENNGAHTFDKPIRNQDGGALCIWTLHSSTKCDINRCSFVNNSAASMAGAIQFFVNVDSKERIVDANVTNSYFLLNDAIFEHGGAIGCDNMNGSATGDKLLLIKFGNCTFAQNMAGFYGPTLYWRGGTKGSLLSMRNCTMISNCANGNRGETNGGHGANININSDNVGHPADDVKFEFLNCVMEDNQCSNGQYSDISLLGTYARNITDITVDNCAISSIIGDENNTIVPSNSYVNYNNGTDKIDAVIHEESSDHVGGGTLLYKGMQWGIAALDFNNTNLPTGDKAHYVMADTPNYYMTKEAAGDTEAAYWTLRGMDISDGDQNGKPRGATPVIGACESHIDELWDIYDTIDDDGNQGEVTNRYPATSGLETVVANGEIELVLSNGVLTGSDNTLFTVYMLNGTKAAEAKGSVDLNAIDGVNIIVAREGSTYRTLKVMK